MNEGMGILHLEKPGKETPFRYPFPPYPIYGKKMPKKTKKWYRFIRDNTPIGITGIQIYLATNPPIVEINKPEYYWNAEINNKYTTIKAYLLGYYI